MKIEYYSLFPLKYREPISKLTNSYGLWGRYFRENKLHYLKDVSVVLLDKEIISWACVSFHDIHNDYWIGCYTNKSYRCMGYGTLATDNTLKHTKHTDLTYVNDFFGSLMKNVNKNILIAI